MVSTRRGGAGHDDERPASAALLVHLADRARDRLDKAEYLPEHEVRLLAQHATACLRVREQEHELELRCREDELELRLARRQAEHELQYRIRADALDLKGRALQIERDADMHRVKRARAWTAVAARLLLLGVGAGGVLHSVASGLDPRDAFEFVRTTWSSLTS